MFKLILAAVQQDLFDAFKKHFSPFPEVEVVFKPFEQVDFDCVVSAANSFGLMDGGVDQCITDYFGKQMMERVQHEIITRYYGEQPVGTSFIVRGNNSTIDPKTGNLKRARYVCHTPTMRIPMDIHLTRNVYMAMKSMLIAVKEHNMFADEDATLSPDLRINTVVCPGLGINTGRVPVDNAAKQMATAYYHFKNPPKKIDWYFASKRHNEIVRAEYTQGEDEIDMSQFKN